MSSILITGSTGFIGKNVVRILKDHKNQNVIELNRSIHNRRTSGKIIFVDWNYSSIKEVLQDLEPDVIIHLGEPISKKIEVDDLYQKINSFLIPIAAIIEAVITIKKKVKLIYIDSGETYGNSSSPFREDSLLKPNSRYGLFKKIVDDFIIDGCSRYDNLMFTILRTSVVYGPGQKNEMLIPSAVSSFVKGNFFKMTQGTQKRDFLFVEDLVNAIEKAVDAQEPINDVFNIAYGKSIQIKEAVELIADISGVPRSLIGIGELPDRIGDQTDYAFDISKAERILNWQPRTTLHEGLTKTVEWYRKMLKNEF